MHLPVSTRYSLYDISRPPPQLLPKKTRFNMFGQSYFLIHRNGFFFGMKVIHDQISNFDILGKSLCCDYSQNKYCLFNWPS